MNQEEQDNVVFLGAQSPTSPPAYTAISYGGGSGNGPMEPQAPLKDYIDVKVEAVESRLMGKIERLPGWNGVAAIVAAVFTGVAIILAAVAFGGDRFDGGFSAGQVASSVQKQNETMFAEIERRQANIDAEQDAKLGSIDEKLDVLIARPQ